MTEPQDAAIPREDQVERSISPIAGRLGRGMRGKSVVMIALVAGCGVFVAATWGSEKPKAERAPTEPARQVVTFEPARRTAPTLAQPGADAPQLQPVSASAGAVPAIDPRAAPTGGGGDVAAQQRARLDAIRGAPILAFSRTSRSPAEVVDPSSGDMGAPTELDQLRRASTIGRARAARVGDRNYLILAGANLPCLLQTAMDTATPGYVSCVIPRDVYSDNGAVVLMEKGTKVLGEYRSGLKQGQKRLFVLWSRAVTPSGVAISLASPAADSLGRAGFDGAIDTHFWDRFGAALLLSIVDDGVYAVAGSGRDYATARLPSDAAGIAVQNSVNIPPSLRKAQGAEVSIFVAQDFDFSSVYGLRSR